MRRIAIVGAGQAGLFLGFSLLDAGYEVTLFCDRDPETVLNSQPMAVPMLFPDALQLERNLGLNVWDDLYPGCDKVRSCACDPQGNLALVVPYTLEKHWQGIDQRLKFYVWMQEFVRRGGELIVRSMTQKDLEECALNYDLVVVAAGRKFISTVFERDEQKSTHDRPERNIACAIVTGLKREENDFFTHQVAFIPEMAEVLQMPFYDKNKGACHVIAFEAVPGSVMDCFGQVQSGREVVEIGKKLIQQFTPWDSERVENIEITDDLAWICGAVTPTVRKPVGRLQNGAKVMGIGDAVILNDPLAAQGGNNATKMAHLVTQRIIERENRPFDEEWMQAVFDEFWQYSQYSNALTDGMLTPGAHLQDIMVCAAQNTEVAKDFFTGFNNPPSVFPWFGDAEEAKKYLERKNANLLASAV